MRSIQDIADEIVDREGGYVNDPDDPGGATKHGVTIGTLKSLGYDLDKDGRVTVSDLRRLSPDQAREIFIEHYFVAPRISDLPQALQPSVFDMHVNSGRNAFKILQRLLCDMGLQVEIDGIIGAQTAAAAARAYALAPNHLADAYGIARRNYYYALGDKNKKLRKFACRRNGGKGGWIIRAEEFISPRFHFSRKEHRARVSKWH